MSWRVLHICEAREDAAIFPDVYPTVHARVTGALQYAIGRVEAALSAEDAMDGDLRARVPRRYSIIVGEGNGGGAFHTVRAVWHADDAQWRIHPADRARLLDTPDLGLALHLGDI